MPKTVEMCNQECKKCMADFEKASIPFDPGMCRYCPNGLELHRLLLKTDAGEQEWGEIDWNSHRFERYYQG